MLHCAVWPKSGAYMSNYFKATLYGTRTIKDCHGREQQIPTVAAEQYWFYSGGHAQEAESRRQAVAFMATHQDWHLAVYTRPRWLTLPPRCGIVGQGIDQPACNALSLGNDDEEGTI